MKNKRIIQVIIMLAGLSALFTMPLQARKCYFSEGTTKNDAGRVSFSNIFVQRDAPVGSTLANVTSTVLSNRGVFVHCDNPFGGTRWQTSEMVPIPYNQEELFNVGIAGVAMRIKTPERNYGVNILTLMPYRTIPLSSNNSSEKIGFSGSAWGSAIFELVKIANTTGSGQMHFPGALNASVVDIDYVYSIRVDSSNLTTVACSVKSSNIIVPMGNVKKNAFTGIGSTAGRQDFTIPLNCDVGTQVKVALNGTTVNGTTGVVALDSHGSSPIAAGVGIQLLYNNQPVTLNTPLAIGLVQQTGDYTIPLTARYYQINNSVTAGQANSSVTFTLTYQ